MKPEIREHLKYIIEHKGDCANTQISCIYCPITKLKYTTCSYDIALKYAKKLLKIAPEDKMYYIQNGYVGNAISWWAENSNGYTCNFKKAQKYTRQQAKHIISNRPNKDMAWDADYIDNAKKAQIITIDGQYLVAKGNRFQRFVK